MMGNRTSLLTSMRCLRATVQRCFFGRLRLLWVISTLASMLLIPQMGSAADSRSCRRAAERISSRSNGSTTVKGYLNPPYGCQGSPGSATNVQRGRDTVCLAGQPDPPKIVANDAPFTFEQAIYKNYDSDSTERYWLSITSGGESTGYQYIYGSAVSRLKFRKNVPADEMESFIRLLKEEDFYSFPKVCGLADSDRGYRFEMVVRTANETKSVSLHDRSLEAGDEDPYCQRFVRLWRRAEDISTLAEQRGSGRDALPKL